MRIGSLKDDICICWYLLDDICICWPNDPHRRQLSSTAMHSLHRSSPRLISDNLIATWQWSTACWLKTQAVYPCQASHDQCLFPGFPSELPQPRKPYSLRCFLVIGLMVNIRKNNEQLDQVGAKNSRSKIGLGVYRLQSTESHPFRKTNDHFQFTPILRITSRSSMHWKSKWTNVRLRISLCHSQPLERLPLPACWKSPADWCVQSIPNHK